MPIVALLTQIIVGPASIIAPTAGVLGVTAAVTDDKAMDHYECQQKGDCK